MMLSNPSAWLYYLMLTSSSTQRVRPCNYVLCIEQLTDVEEEDAVVLEESQLPATLVVIDPLSMYTPEM